jgi:hypothetical protein
LPGTNGNVAFSLKPTADVTGEGCVPGMGPRNFGPWAKYIRPESRKSTGCDEYQTEVLDNEITWNWFYTSRIRGTDILLYQDGVFGVVPISKNNGKFPIVFIYLLWWMNY